MSWKCLIDEVVECDRNAGFAQFLFRLCDVCGIWNEGDLCALDEFGSMFALITDTDLGAAQIAQHTHMFVQMGRGGSDVLQCFGVCLESAVGEVDAKYPDTAGNEFLDGFLSVAGGAQGGDDLGENVLGGGAQVGFV